MGKNEDFLVKVEKTDLKWSDETLAKAILQGKMQGRPFNNAATREKKKKSWWQLSKTRRPVDKIFTLIELVRDQ